MLTENGSRIAANALSGLPATHGPVARLNAARAGKASIIIRPKSAGDLGWVGGSNNRFINILLFVSPLSYVPLCGCVLTSVMSYTPLGDFGQQGLFDITRILLQQPDLAALE
ncbi:hypothetical protein DMH17_01245 [Raoultella planticola]|nr:hypothetical protein [Raoultella planticola]